MATWFNWPVTKMDSHIIMMLVLLVPHVLSRLLQPDAHNDVHRAAAVDADWFKYDGRSQAAYDEVVVGLKQYKQLRLQQYPRQNVTSLKLRHELPGVLDDVMLTPQQVRDLLRQHASRSKRKVTPFVLHPEAKWDTTIPYKVDSSVYTGMQESYLDESVRQWEAETCLHFRKHAMPETLTQQHILFTKKVQVDKYLEDSCLSYIGKTDVSSLIQPLYIGTECMDTVFGILVHEIGHALGLHHEHQRPDRDDFVNILTNNIQPMALSNFDILDSSNLETKGTPYDLSSIMHYSSTDFSKQSTSNSIEPKDMRLLTTMGQRSTVAFYDSKIINMAYCADVCSSSSLVCEHGGYPDPKDCSRCRCPDPFTGGTCAELTGGSAGCSPLSSTLPAMTTTGAVCMKTPRYEVGQESSYNPGDWCTWKIQLPSSCAIKLYFKAAGQWPRLVTLKSNVCGDWAEIRADGPDRMGERLCGGNGISTFKYTKENPLVTSTSEVIISFRSFVHINPFIWYLRLGFEFCYEPVNGACIVSGASTTDGGGGGGGGGGATTPSGQSSTRSGGTATPTPSSLCFQNRAPRAGDILIYYTVNAVLSDVVYSSELLNEYSNQYIALATSFRSQVATSFCQSFGWSFNDLNSIRFTYHNSAVVGSFIVELMLAGTSASISSVDVRNAVSMSAIYGSIALGNVVALPGRDDRLLPPADRSPAPRDLDVGAIVGIALSVLTVVVIFVLVVSFVCKFFNPTMSRHPPPHAPPLAARAAPPPARPPPPPQRSRGTSLDPYRFSRSYDTAAPMDRYGDVGYYI